MDHHLNWASAAGNAELRPALSDQGSGATAPCDGWALAASNQSHSARWGNNNSNASSNANAALDDAIGRFGSLNLGAGPSANGGGAMVEHPRAAGRGGVGHGGGVDDLDMGSLRVAGQAGGVAGAGYQQGQVSLRCSRQHITAVAVAERRTRDKRRADD